MSCCVLCGLLREVVVAASAFVAGAFVAASAFASAFAAIAVVHHIVAVAAAAHC